MARNLRVEYPTAINDLLNRGGRASPMIAIGNDTAQ